MIVHVQCRSISIPTISCHISGEGIEIIYVRFIVAEVTLEEVFLTVLRLSPISNVPPMLLTHLRPNTAVTR
jgi:hypothetical protein